MFRDKYTKFYNKVPSFLSPLFVIFFILAMVYSVSLLSKGRIPTLALLVFSISLFSLLGTICFLFRQKINSSINENILLNDKSKIHRILEIIFFNSITLALIILSNVNYVKPLVYYIFIGVATASIALQIVLKLQISEKNAFKILFQIVTLALVIRASSLYLSPYHIGIDTHQFHYPHIFGIILNGFLNPLSFYYYQYPFSHIIQAVSGLLIDFSISHFKLINLSHSLILIPFGYLIGTHLANKKVGLMCSLLFSISTMGIFITLFSTSKIGGASLLFMSLYLLLKLIERPKIKLYYLLFFCTSGVFMWHPELAASLFFILFSYYLTKIYVTKNIKSYSLFLSYSVFYISYNMYVSRNIFSNVVEGLFLKNIDKSSSLIQNFTTNSFSMDFLSQLFLSYIGITLPFFFTAYFLLSNSKRPEAKKFFLMTSFLFVCLLPVAGVFSNNFSLNPTRMLTYISLISLILTSYSIFVVFNFKNRMNISLFILIIFIFSIFSTSSYVASDGSEVYNDQIPVVVIYTTKANIVASKFIDFKIPLDETIHTDPTTFGLLNLNHEVVASSSFNDEGYVLINSYNLERRKFVIDDSSIQHKKNKLYTNNFNTIHGPPIQINI